MSAWVAGTLADDARAQAIAHIATCASCREAVSALARIAPTADGEAPLDARAEATGWVPGATLGRYVIEDVVARGGMGVVLVADDPTLHRKVAIKVRRPAGGARQAGLEARLLEEARALAQLRHPNVVAVFDAGKDGDQLYMVMELVEGESLRAWLARRPGWRDALGVCVAVGRGIEALHHAGLAHRDVKPDNVLLARDGRVLLADLGLVVRTGGAEGPEGSSDPALTAQGAVVGTPRYIAPEQLAGERGDARSDQFGFAVTMREALTAADEPLPGRLRAVIQRAMDPDPRYRFASMTELLAAVEAAPRSGFRSRPARVVLAVTGLAATGFVVAELWPASPEAPVAPVASAAPAGLAVGPADAAAADTLTDTSDVLPSEMLAALERKLGVISTPADYDPRHFDPIQGLGVATRMARSLIDDATLSGFVFASVGLDGHVSITLACGDSNQCVYVFRSPSRSKLPDGAPRNASIERKCKVIVSVEPTRMTAQEINTTECASPIGPPPRCTFAQIWARAREQQGLAPIDSIQVPDLAARVGWIATRGWNFVADPKRLGGGKPSIDLDDDC